MKRLFKITDLPYRFDHEHFDEDIDNIILLTNEDIKANELTEEDYEYYVRVVNLNIEARNKRSEKRKLSQEKSKSKRQRIMTQYEYLQE